LGEEEGASCSQAARANGPSPGPPRTHDALVPRRRQRRQLPAAAVAGQHHALAHVRQLPDQGVAAGPGGFGAAREARSGEIGACRSSGSLGGGSLSRHIHTHTQSRHAARRRSDATRRRHSPGDQLPQQLDLRHVVKQPRQRLAGVVPQDGVAVYGGVGVGLFTWRGGWVVAAAFHPNTTRLPTNRSQSTNLSNQPENPAPHPPPARQPVRRALVRRRRDREPPAPHHQRVGGAQPQRGAATAVGDVDLDEALVADAGGVGWGVGLGLGRFEGGGRSCARACSRAAAPCVRVDPKGRGQPTTPGSRRCRCAPGAAAPEGPGGPGRRSRAPGPPGSVMTGPVWGRQGGRSGGGGRGAVDQDECPLLAVERSAKSTGSSYSCTKRQSYQRLPAAAGRQPLATGAARFRAHLV
jgi:hypothetical protein